MNRPSKEQYYLGIALAVSKRSTCIKRHYGAVIVKDDIIIATGYNGSPRGEANCCDTHTCERCDCKRYEGYEKCPAVHAEQNAIIACDRGKMIGATLYLVCETPHYEEYYELDTGIRQQVMTNTYEDMADVKPCNLCSRMIKNAGIAKVVTRAGVVGWD